MNASNNNTDNTDNTNVETSTLLSALVQAGFAGVPVSYSGQKFSITPEDTRLTDEVIVALLSKSGFAIQNKWNSSKKHDYKDVKDGEAKFLDWCLTMWLPGVEADGEDDGTETMELGYLQAQLEKRGLGATTAKKLTGKRSKMSGWAELVRLVTVQEAIKNGSTPAEAAEAATKASENSSKVAEFRTGKLELLKELM